MALLTMALLTMALLTMALLTMALLTMALLTMALLTMALLTMALLTMVLLTMVLLTMALITSYLPPIEILKRQGFVKLHAWAFRAATSIARASALRATISRWRAADSGGGIRWKEIPGTGVGSGVRSGVRSHRLGVGIQ